LLRRVVHTASAAQPEEIDTVAKQHATNHRLITRRSLLRQALGTAASLVVIGLCGPVSITVRANNASTAVVQWNNAALQAIRDTKPGPPIVARMLAIIHTAIYDARAYALSEGETGAPVG
jgi:hypothetical protein